MKTVTKALQKLRLYFRSKSSSQWRQTLLFILLFSLLIAQQLQIADLQYRLDYITSHETESYPSRLTNLEYIINAHTASIKESDSDIWYLKESLNDLRWRIMQLEWLKPPEVR